MFSRYWPGSGQRIVLALIVVAKTPIQSFAGNQNQRKDESEADSGRTGRLPARRTRCHGAEHDRLLPARDVGQHRSGFG
jgi:hypothetical protein